MKRLWVLLLTLVMAVPLMGATPVAYFPLDGDFLDYAGSYDMAAPATAPVFVEGIIGQCISSSAQEPDRQYITDYPTTNLSQAIANNADFSVAYWMKTTDAGTGGNVWQEPTPVGSENPYEADWWTFLDTSGSINFGCRPDDRAMGLLVSPDPVNDDQWHHIAVSRNNSDGNVRLYVDGELVAEATDTGYIGNCADDDTRSVQIGGGNPGEANTQYVGLVDEVYFFNVVLTPEEVALNMNPFAVVITDPLDEAKNIQTPYTFTWDSMNDITGYEVVEFSVWMGDDEAVVSDPNLDNPTEIASMILADEVVIPGVDGSGEISLTTEDIEFSFNTEYFWRVEMTIGLPDGLGGYSELKINKGETNSFYGPLSCPKITMGGDVYVLPDPGTLSFDGKTATVNATIEALNPVQGVQWYEAGAPDSVGVALTNGADGYSWTYDNTGTSLTIENPISGNMYYYCDATTGNNGDQCTETSEAAKVNVRQGLVHRYSFDSDISDSIGDADGVVVDASGDYHSYADGKLTLSNIETIEGVQGNIASGNLHELEDPNGAWVDLPNGMISELHDWATIMIWYDVTRPENLRPDWERVFDFGTAGSGIEDESTGNGRSIFVRPGTPSSQDIMFHYEGSGDLYTAVFDKQETGEQCVAIVINGTTGQWIPYVNGKFVKSFDALPAELPLEGHVLNLGVRLYNLEDRNVWLGRSMWNDSLFTGTYNELRIYDVPLTGTWIEAIYEAGPDSLDANPCINPSAADFDGDCMVDMIDLTKLATDWLTCGYVDCL